MTLLFAVLAGAGEMVTVRQDTLRQEVESYLQVRATGAGVQPELKRITGLKDQVLPAGSITYEVLAPQQWEGWGKASLALIIRVNDQVVRNLPLQVEVAGWRDVLVAARPLERSEALRPQDVMLERRDLAMMRGVPLLSIAEVAGKRLKAAVRQGTVLYGNNLEKIMLVTAGQQVTILLENEVLRVTTMGKVKSPGALGDTVMVLNSGSQKEFPARVVDAKTVRVDF